jgi:ferric-dicitrate binding protein FerR (iron transport regulator)
MRNRRRLASLILVLLLTSLGGLAAAGEPQGAGKLAGKVSAAIPAESVQRPGETKEITLKIQDAVNWEDLVKTLEAGRVRIALLDGSFLNVGARSVMKITRHDPQTQQTLVEMTTGHIRGEVVKLTRPGASFQVKTPTAVIGVVGTIFIIWVTPEFTRVFCIEGRVNVRNADPSVSGTVTLEAGFQTTVGVGQPPIPVGPTAGTVQQAEISQTDIGNVAPGGGGGRAPGGPGGGAPGVEARVVARPASTVMRAGTLAAGAAAAATAGLASSSAGGARSALDTATSNLASAQSTLAQATSSANGASAAASNAASAAQGLAGTISGPGPCGCH